MPNKTMETLNIMNANMKQEKKHTCRERKYNKMKVKQDIVT